LDIGISGPVYVDDTNHENYEKMPRRPMKYITILSSFGRILAIRPRAEQTGGDECETAQRDFR
jgi:hypothetical protein